MFEGLIRRDPIDKDEIVVANMSAIRVGHGLRPEIIDNLKLQNPDLLFFAAIRRIATPNIPRVDRVRTAIPRDSARPAMCEHT